LKNKDSNEDGFVLCN